MMMVSHQRGKEGDDIFGFVFSCHVYIREEQLCTIDEIY